MSFSLFSLPPILITITRTNPGFPLFIIRIGFPFALLEYLSIVSGRDCRIVMMYNVSFELVSENAVSEKFLAICERIIG